MPARTITIVVLLAALAAVPPLAALFGQPTRPAFGSSRGHSHPHRDAAAEREQSQYCRQQQGGTDTHAKIVRIR